MDYNLGTPPRIEEINIFSRSETASEPPWVCAAYQRLGSSRCLKGEWEKWEWLCLKAVSASKSQIQHFYLFLLTKLTALDKGELDPQLTGKRRPCRRSRQSSCPSGARGQILPRTNVGPPIPISPLSPVSWGCQSYLLFLSFLKSNRALQTYSESSTFPSEVFSPGENA